MEWNKNFRYSNISNAYSVEQTDDLGYIISGYTGNAKINGYKPDININVLIIKTDEYGNEEWNKTFHFKDMNAGYCIQQTIDKGYIIAGTTISIDDFTRSAILIKIDN